MPDASTEISSENADLGAVDASSDFVGRQREMKGLVAALDNALSGP